MNGLPAVESADSVRTGGGCLAHPSSLSSAGGLPGAPQGAGFL